MTVVDESARDEKRRRRGASMRRQKDAFQLGLGQNLHGPFQASPAANRWLQAYN